MHSLSLTQIYRESWEWAKHNSVLLIAIAILINAFPIVLLSLFSEPVSSETLGWTSYRGQSILGVATSVATQALIFSKMRLDLFGPTKDGLSSWELASHLMPQILFITLISGTLVLLGLFALIIPGIIMALMWAVAIPSLAVEDLGLREALARSAELTKGHRFRILGYLLLSFTLFIIIFILWQLLVEIITGGDIETAGLWLLMMDESLIAFTGVSLVIMQMVLFKSLSQIHDGLGGQTSQVFD